MCWYGKRPRRTDLANKHVHSTYVVAPAFFHWSACVSHPTRGNQFWGSRRSSDEHHASECRPLEAVQHSGSMIYIADWYLKRTLKFKVCIHIACGSHERSCISHGTSGPCPTSRALCNHLAHLAGQLGVCMVGGRGQRQTQKKNEIANVYPRYFSSHPYELGNLYPLACTSVQYDILSHSVSAPAPARRSIRAAYCK